MTRLFLAFLLFSPPLVRAQQLLLTTIGDCNNGVGRLRVSWNAPGTSAVRILVGLPPNQQPLTGLEPPQGSADTGDWVTDGLPFVLSTESGQVLASATAALGCDGSNALRAALVNLGWIPLQVGNRWVYRGNTRQITANHVTRTIQHTVEVEGLTYYLLDNPETLLRADAEGRVFQRISGRDTLLLDPTDAPSPQAVLRIESRTSEFSTRFGSFPGSLSYRTMAPLRLEFGTYVRGLGLLSSTASVLAGSSGGFSDGLDLQEARIGGKLYFRRPSPALTLGVEATEFDLTARRVTNCAVPCYFVACGLVPGADPEGTFKPCFQSRIGVEQGSAGAIIELALVAPGGAAVHSVTLTPANPADYLHYQQLPLYSAPNQPYPPGKYHLRARLLDAGGTERATAAASFQIY